MIKIIKQGTRQKVTCSECGCEFSYEEEDTKTTPPDPHGLVPTKKYVNCPQCDSEYVIRQLKTLPFDEYSGNKWKNKIKDHMEKRGI